jgi:hypothetical protein
MVVEDQLRACCPANNILGTADAFEPSVEAIWSLIEMIASAVVAGGEPHQFSSSKRQPSFPGDFSDFAVNSR